MIQSATSSVIDMLIVGGSTRAAAFSAMRAGLRPLCLDQYADLDLQKYAPVQRVDDYPDALIEILPSLTRLPLLYVGGLENHPDIISVAKQYHDLWGNDETVVTNARRPQNLQMVAQLARVQTPEWRDVSNPPDADGTWVLRPRFGSGGNHMVRWTEDLAAAIPLTEDFGFQKFIPGLSYSATFVASREPGDVRYVGVTRQLVGESACHALPFQWCGNIGPVALEVNAENNVRRLGNVLKWKLGLVGIFGVDFIVDPEGIVWVTEVNPRYPASLEILEHATGTPILAHHCRCFDGDFDPSSAWSSGYRNEFLGKAILYSPDSLQVMRPLMKNVDDAVQTFPKIADIPAVGEQFEPGDPVCSVYGTGLTLEETWERLQAGLKQVEEQLQLQPV